MLPPMLEQYDDARRFLRDHMLCTYGIDGSGVTILLKWLKYYTNQMVAIIQEGVLTNDDDTPAR